MSTIKNIKFHKIYRWLIIVLMSAYLPATRPFAVTITLWGVILFGLWNVGKAAALARNSEMLLARSVQYDPRLQAALALVWAVLFLAAAWQLGRKRPSTRHGIPILLLLFSLYTMGVRLLFSPLPPHTGAWQLTAFFFIGVVVLSYLALNRARRRAYFDV